DDLGHLHIRALARAAVAAALPRWWPRAALPRRRGGSWPRVRRLGRAPDPRGRGAPPRGGPRPLRVLAPVSRAALRRDHGGQLIEALAVLAAVLAAVAYARGVRRVKRRRWPVWRTGVFFLGIATLLLARVPALEAIAADLFSVHMLQHVLLTMIAPPLLFIGEPVRPVLLGLPDVLRARIVRPLAGNGAVRGLVHVLRHPLVAVVLFVGGVYLWHWPPLYDGAVEDARIHVLEHAHFFGAAMLFWSVVIDPLPFRGTLPYSARIIYPLLPGAAHNRRLGGILSFSTRL